MLSDIGSEVGDPLGVDDDVWVPGGSLEGVLWSVRGRRERLQVLMQPRRGAAMSVIGCEVADPRGVDDDL